MLHVVVLPVACRLLPGPVSHRNHVQGILNIGGAEFMMDLTEVRVSASPSALRPFVFLQLHRMSMAPRANGMRRARGAELESANCAMISGMQVPERRASLGCALGWARC